MNHQTIPRICRLCLSDGGTLIDVLQGNEAFDCNLKETVQELLHIQVVGDEAVAWLICSACAGKLDDFVLFKSRCLEGNTTFEDIYLSSKGSCNVRAVEIEDDVGGYRSDPSCCPTDRNDSGDDFTLYLDSDSDEESCGWCSSDDNGDCRRTEVGHCTEMDVVDGIPVIKHESIDLDSMEVTYTPLWPVSPLEADVVSREGDHDLSEQVEVEEMCGEEGGVGGSGGSERRELEEEEEEDKGFGEEQMRVRLRRSARLVGQKRDYGEDNLAEEDNIVNCKGVKCKRRVNKKVKSRSDGQLSKKWHRAEEYKRKCKMSVNEERNSQRRITRAECLRTRRTSLNEEDKAVMIRHQVERNTKRRALRTEEERAELRRRKTEYIRKWRASLNKERKAEIIKRQVERYKEQWASLTKEEKVEKRRYNVEWTGKWRASLSGEKKADVIKRQRERNRKWRASLRDERKAEMKEKQLERQRKWRASLSGEKKADVIKRQRERNRKWRASLSDERKAEMKEKQLERQRKWRASLSGEKKADVKKRQRETKRKWRASLRDERKAEMKEKQLERQRKWRASLTMEERAEMRKREAKRKRKLSASLEEERKADVRRRQVESTRKRR